MRRLIAVFILALLPLQFSWSAVATYCMHERATAQTQHVGHHEHEHEAKSVVDPADKNGQNADQVDSDCWVCHGVGIGALNLFYAKLACPRLIGGASLLLSVIHVRPIGGCSCACRDCDE